MKFVEDFDISLCSAASYNPRVITEEGKAALQKSLSEFGIVKPIIVMPSGLLLAGHQRTNAMKACGIKNCPAFILDRDVLPVDEKIFNVEHNRIEGDSCLGEKLLAGNCYEPGMRFFAPDEVTDFRLKTAGRLKPATEMILSYGNFYSFVANIKGEVVEGKIGLYAAKRLNVPILGFILPDEKAAAYYKTISENQFGVYNIEATQTDDYFQNLLQPMRKKNVLTSLLLRNGVVPHLGQDRSKRILDFGAGRLYSYHFLRNNGYKIDFYEPFLVGGSEMNLPAIGASLRNLQRQVTRHGLYDLIYLDSVLNAVKNADFDNYVMGTITGLLKDDGIFFCTRYNSLSTYGHAKNSDDSLPDFTDDQNRMIIVARGGVFASNKFHTDEQFVRLLTRFWGSYELVSTGYIGAVCRHPKRDTEFIKTAFEKEFNFSYGGFSFNLHGEIYEAAKPYWTRKN
ncbi:hypothetical protein FACS189454_08640 [Planctomycetales bacterium]|nr:hypothetical protein FACS189454_08640 [Planctomycetales bacterium]